MNYLPRLNVLSCFVAVLLFFSVQVAQTTPDQPQPQDPAQKEKRGVGLETASPSPTPNSVATASTRTNTHQPEIVLQAGITSPQTEIRFSPDGRLLASMGMFGNAIKLWEVSSGRLLRQLESSIPSMGASSLTRPFRFSSDGRTLVAFAEGRLRRWDVESGRELNNVLMPAAKDFFVALLSDDGRILAALNMDSSAARLWETASGRELRPISFKTEEHLADQDSIALSPDGTLLAALTSTVKGSMKGLETRQQVTIWETASGRSLTTLKVKQTNTQFSQGLGQISPEQVISLAFSPDGAWLAVRDDTSLKIWDVASGRELKIFSLPSVLGPQSNPMFIMLAGKFLFSPDKQTLSLASEGNRIDLFDVSTTNKLRSIAPQGGNVVSLSYSPDGKLLASSLTDNQIKLWELATGREVKTLSGAAMPISDLAFARDGKSLAIAGQEAVSSWELSTGGVRRAVALPDDFARSPQNGLVERVSLLSPDGRWLIAGSESQSVAKIWNVVTGREQPAISLAPGKQLGNAAFAEDGSMLVLAERSTQKPGVPGASPTSSTSTQVPGRMPAGISPDSMAKPDMSKMMEMARKDPKKMQEQMKKVQEAMSKGDLGAGMSMMESLGMLPAASKTNKSANNLRLVDVASGNQLRAIPLPGGFFNDMAANSMMSSSALAFSPDGGTLASASGFSAPILLTDTKTGQELRSLKTSFSMSVNSLIWSPDGKRLASAHWGLKRNLADPKAAENFSFEDISFSIKLWDTQTGAELATLPGHNNFVNRLAFNTDGRLLASGGYDSSIKLWDAGSGRELRTLVGHSGSINALDFSPDGRILVSGSDDGSARLWKTDTGELLATLVSLNKGQDWLVVTPAGLFDGSPGGWKQILWRFTPALFDVSPVEIFFNEYFHPGLLADILAGRKVEAPVDISKKDRRQPRITLEAREAQSGTVAARTVNVKINIPEAPAGAKDVRLFRNGSLVKAWRGDSPQSPTSLETSVSLVAGRNELTAYAFNRDNVKSSDATLSITGADSLKRPATFHLLVIGLDEYANPAYNLKYAKADALAFAEEVERQQRKLGKYDQFEVVSLLNRNATKANLLNALKRLAGGSEASPGGEAGVELARITPAQPEDAVVIFFAGHGTAQQQRFYLIPHDLGYQGKRTELDEAGLREIMARSVSDLELEQALEGIDAGLMLMVIDACNSGQALEAEEKRRGPMNSKGLAQLAYEKGVYILTAAQSYQAALEAEQLGHGYLTYALVEEGLKSDGADVAPEDGQVFLREWLDFATERVPKMQEAKMRAARGVRLEIAFVEGEEKSDLDKRNVQRPRVFYRREQEPVPLIVATPQ